MKLKGMHIRLIVTGVLAGILLLVIDIPELRDSIRSVSLMTLMTAAVGYAATQIISASKWWILLQAAGNRISLLRSVRAFFIGMYVNAFCLGTVGGDLTRALLVSTSSSRGVNLATVVADRALGLGTLASIGILSGLIFGSISQQPVIAAVAFLVIIAAAAIWRFAPALTALISRRLPSLGGKISRMSDAFPRDPKVISRALLVAALYHFSQIAVIGAIIHQVGGTVPVPYLLFAVPFINILTTLPLSWMGFGVRETAYVLFFAPAFLTHEKAVLVGVIWLVGMTIASGVGGIIAALSGDLAVVRTSRASCAAPDNAVL